MAPGSEHRTLDGKRRRRIGISGITLGALMVLACELPILLAVIGFGSLSAAFIAFKPPFIVEMVGIFIAVAGAMLLSGFTLRRVWLKKKGARF